MNIDNYQQLILNQPMSYRSKLTIPENTAFGMEIELEKVDFEFLKDEMEDYNNWQVKKDLSLSERGGEVVSPVLKNTTKTWQELKRISDFLEMLPCKHDNCAFQVTFNNPFSPRKTREFASVFAYYEDIIFYISKGFDDKLRESAKTYSHQSILMLKDVFDNEKYYFEVFNNNKLYGYSLKKDYLLEFRTPNSTSNILLWQNYITLFYYLMDSVTKNKHDMDFINHYILNFNEIDLEGRIHYDINKAIDFANVIFENTTDKTYFLDQYEKVKKLSK